MLAFSTINEIQQQQQQQGNITLTKQNQQEIHSR